MLDEKYDGRRMGVKEIGEEDDDVYDHKCLPIEFPSILISRYLSILNCK